VTAAKQQLLESPDLFLTHYFGEKLYGLKDFHLRLIETATTQERGLVLYPAGHGKTTLISTLLPIWALCKDPNVRIAIVAKSETEAENIGRAIIAELSANEELIRDFGPFKPTDDGKPWSLTAISVEKRTLRAKEPTLGLFGSGSKSVLGYRTNWTICDDVINEKNSATVEQRGKVREWFNQSLDTMNLPGGRTTVVGTLFDPEDLYNDLILLEDPETGLPIWHVQREDAIVNEEERQPLWPEWWPWPKLMAKKASMGTLDFNKRYRNIAVDASRMVFREEYVKGGYAGNVRYPGCLDRNYKVGDYDPLWRRVSGFDPAIGAYRSAKFCAHLTLAMGSCRDHEKCIWVVDLERDQMSLIQQVELILTKHAQYDLWASVVEANAYQQGLLDALQKRMQEETLAYKVEPHYTTRTNKPDPELGVGSMSRWFENGWVHIPWGNAESQRKMKLLVDELVMYPDARTTDCVMSFWFAWRQLQETAPRFSSFNRLEKSGSWWGKRSSGRVVRNPYYERQKAELEADVSAFVDRRSG
jgi:hypothetical protein